MRTERSSMQSLAVFLVLASCGVLPAAETTDPLPTFAEMCFRARSAKSFLPMASAERILEAVGPESRLFVGDNEKTRLKGLFRVREWTPDCAVRVAVTEPSQHWRIHLWGHGHGVSIFLLPAGAAYRITEEPGGPGWHRELRQAMSALVTTDDRRGVRLPESAYQFRCQDGSVVVTKGDARVMTIPLQGPADKFYLEAPVDATLNDLALIRSGPAPDELLPNHSVILDGRQPAQLPWKETLPAAARFERLSDGCVELSAKDSNACALAAVSIAGPGLYEVLFQVDEATSRTGIALLNSKGEPQEGIEFGRDGRNPLAFNFGNPREQPWLGNFDFANRPVPLAGPRQWLRLVVSGGWAKCSISGDGIHWGSVLDFRDRNISFQSIALYVREPGDRNNTDLANRHIRLRSLQVRELSGLTSAADARLSAKAAAADVTLKSDRGESPQAWVDRIARLKPEGASPTAWRYACTLRALAAPLSGDAGESLLYRAIRERLSELPTFQAKIALLQDAALLWRSRRDSVERQLALWEQLGREVLNAGSGADFDHYRQAAAEVSLGDPPDRYGSISWELARDAVILFYVEHRPRELESIERQVAFWRVSDPNFGSWRANEQLDPLLQWLDAHPLGKAGRSQDASDVTRMVTPPLNRVASNMFSELLAALEGKQFADAARIVVTCEPPRGDGLVAAPGDDALFASFQNVLRLVVFEHPELRDAMVRQFGPADQLKIEQALAQGDPVSVEALPLQYCGTPAAVAPCQWLGDRALAAADFAQAYSWYDEGLRSASSTQQPDLAARKRLVSAMLGSAEGQPPTHAVSFGGTKVSPAQFEGWIRDALARRRTAAELASAADELPLVTMPQPVVFQASSFALLQESEGRGFHRDDFPPDFREVDWSWRHLTLRVGEDTLLAVERPRIAAFDLADGKPRWDFQLRNGWSPAPVRPLIVGPRIYIRAVTLSDRAGVVCLDVKTGRKLWMADCGGAAVADPLWRRGRLFVPTIGSAGEQFAAMLCLVELNAETGEVLSRRSIAETAETEKVQSECQASWAGNRLVILLAGSVICTDLQGKVVWLRQETLLPRAIDPGSARQQCLPAVASEGRLFVEQPGNCAIDCLSLATGQRQWRRGIVGLHAIVDLPEDRLLVRTAHGFVALSKATGDVLWQREFPGLLSALARTTSGLILCARLAVNQDKPQIIFLDPATGRTRAHSTLSLERKQPKFVGPIVTRGDRTWCCFGYGAADDSPTAENDKRIIELRPGKPAVDDEGP
jgi:outer membrane protein assembly factor BamB